MDTDRQLHEQDATGWQRGLYDDITHTFRAPIVNWIFRTVTANEPAFTRYLWGQVKPVFETRAFAEFSVAYRDAVLAATDDDARLPRYRPTDVSLDPAAYRELRGQLATYDVVATGLDEGLGSYNVTVTSDNEIDESKSLVSPTRSLNQTAVSPGGTVNVTVSGQLSEEDTVVFQDGWSPVANDSAIISTSVDFLFPEATDRNIGLASGNPVDPGPLEIVYEIYLPDDVEQGTVYEWEPKESSNGSALEVGAGDDKLPVLGDQSFQITNLTDSTGPDPVSTPLDESTQTLAAENAGSLVSDSMVRVAPE